MTKSNRQKQVLTDIDDLFLLDIVEGLSMTPQKELPRDYLYDEKGWQLLEEACDTPEFYQNRIELAILEQVLPEVANMIGPQTDILAYTAQADVKIQKLIAELEAPNSVTLIEGHEVGLTDQAEKLQNEYPEIDVHCLVADLQSEWTLPAHLVSNSDHKKVVFLPGSAISRFDSREANHFIKNIRRIMRPGDALIMGADLVKPMQRQIAAYNDLQGKTAAFNKNLLVRIRDNYETNLDVDTFAHHAIYNSEQCRVEMHLVSMIEQVVEIEGHCFDFNKLDSIRTDNAYKYTIDSLQMMTFNAGFDCVDCFADVDNLFSIHYLTAR